MDSEPTLCFSERLLDLFYSFQIALLSFMFYSPTQSTAFSFAF